MKKFLYFLAFTLFASTASATNYGSDSLTVTVTKPTGSPYSAWSWSAAVFYASNPSVVQYTLSVGGGSAASQSVTVPAILASTGRNSEPFYVVVFAGASGIWTAGSVYPARWISSYPGTTGGSVNGPYSGTTAMDNTGDIVANPAVGTPSVPTSYEQTLTLVNSSNVVQCYQVVMTGSSGNVLSSQNYFIQPNSSNMIYAKESVPFNLNAYQMYAQSSSDANGNPTTNLIRQSSTPAYTTAGLPTLNPTPSGPSMTVTGDNNTATPSALASSAQQQTLNSGDEITGAIKDSSANMLQVAQKLDSTNIALGNANTTLTAIQTGQNSTNSTLGAIKGSVDGNGTQLAGIGTSLTTLNNTATATGNDISTIKQALTSTTRDGDGPGGIDSGAVSTGANATSFVSGLGARLTSINTSLTALVNASGLGTMPGSYALVWSVAIAGNSYSITLEPYANYISDLRDFELWVCGIFFARAVYRVIRGTFAEEAAA